MLDRMNWASSGLGADMKMKMTMERKTEMENILGTQRAICAATVMEQALAAVLAALVASVVSSPVGRKRVEMHCMQVQVDRGLIVIGL